ncbi:hypothetical protein J2X20_002168 [Pelomonas saccharophila]|uniref:Uncharacterized protein n=1 Tax=Roseateles saccharophilus TaxID=304 RepID=A0ABU1YL06_ROSSA|nr:hypothetical protein [Roseateles saccharophilus]MDR7269539.1 hypothetical protein [Roseateles saccharophilus]
MASRIRKPRADVDPPAPVVPGLGLPVRLLPHDWPFLYSVLANGDVVVNKRLALAQPAKAGRKRVDTDAGDALM